jgi:hypothetical protein
MLFRGLAVGKDGPDGVPVQVSLAGRAVTVPLTLLASQPTEMYLVCRHLVVAVPGGLSPMSTSPLDPQEIRAAAEAHQELGPDYKDAVIESFLERIDREITARVDARLGPVSREQPAQPVQQPAPPNNRRTLLTGVAIGIAVTGIPSMAVASAAGGVIPGDETGVLIVLAILWAIAVAIAAYAYPVRHHRRRQYGVR